MLLLGDVWIAQVSGGVTEQRRHKIRHPNRHSGVARTGAPTDAVELIVVVEAGKIVQWPGSRLMVR